MYEVSNVTQRALELVPAKWIHLTDTRSEMLEMVPELNFSHNVPQCKGT